MKELQKLYISIHALRGEGDCAIEALKEHIAAISIHALRGEGDKTVKSET